MAETAGRLIENLRATIGDAVLSRVVGHTGNRSIDQHEPGWFAPDAVIRIVHADASMFVGGLRALVLQSLHPSAMAGVAAHSGFRGDPWGRLQRTSAFLGATTFGSAAVAERAVARVRAVHAGVTGVDEHGTPYSASDPHLLRWVHLAETDSFLRAHQRFGERRLNAGECDDYVAQNGIVSAKLGVDDPPRTVAELDEQLHAYRPELRGTPAARDAARYLLFTPPLPLIARPGYGLIAAAAVSLLPTWARIMLWLPPPMPVVDSLVGRVTGGVATGLIRWSIAGEPASA
jgi:uncharacterized protein (DUF2236 family)